MARPDVPNLSTDGAWSHHLLAPAERATRPQGTLLKSAHSLEACDVYTKRVPTHWNVYRNCLWNCESVPKNYNVTIATLPALVPIDVRIKKIHGQNNLRMQWHNMNVSLGRWHAGLTQTCLFSSSNNQYGETRDLKWVNAISYVYRFNVKHQ